MEIFLCTNNMIFLKLSRFGLTILYRVHTDIQNSMAPLCGKLQIYNRDMAEFLGFLCIGHCPHWMALIFSCVLVQFECDKMDPPELG
jgi:hypothetical protein